MQLPRPGEILEGKYRLEEMLGEGAFGLVVKATTVSTQRPVAVKILKPARDGQRDARAQRFMRELRVIAKLQCPNTLTLFDFGRTDTGVLYMVTEFVEGEDLYDLLARRGKLRESESMHILHQCLLSLAEAHELGVLHRDIKPHNIRLTQYGDDPLRVKVLDFGLSKSMEGEEGSTLTAAGLAVGTPRYMSPEQLSGKELGPQSDIYSLGLVAYEMLVGEPANPLDSVVGPRRRISIPEDANVSPHLRNLVNGMLQRAGEDRYASATEVLAALKSVRAGQPPSAPASSSGYRPQVPAGSSASVSAGRSLDPYRLSSGERSRSSSPESPPTPTRSPKWMLVGGVAAVVVVVGLGIAALTQSPGGGEDALSKEATARENPFAAVAVPNVVDDPEPEDTGLATQPVVEPEVGARGCSGLGSMPPGVSTLRSVDGLDRLDVLVYIPDDYDPTRPHPAIWFFHDSTSKAEAVLEHIPQAGVDDLPSFVVIAPRTQMLTVWYTEQEYHAAAPTLDLAREQLCLDPDRLYVWGHGFGGRVALRQGLCMDDVAAVATTNYRERFADTLCEPRRKVPYLHVGATKDPVAPAEGGAGCYDHWIALRCKGPGCGQSPSMATHVDFFKERYGCKGTKRKARGLRETCETWSCDAPFVSCVAEGGRGLKGVPQLRDLSCPQSEPADFAYFRTVWEFFSQFERAQER